MTIVEFIRQRLDEDEASARAAHVETTLPAVWSALFEASGYSGPSVQAAMIHVARHDPARVLAQVAAMRAIVDLHPEMLGFCQGCASERFPCRTLQRIAAIWSSHPDYDPAWSPDA